MELSQLTDAETRHRAIAGLGFDSSNLTFASPEVLSEQIRCFASLFTPVTPRRLIASVLESVRFLVVDPIPIRQVIEDLVDSLVAHGDIVEAVDPMSARRRLYLTSPSFVMRNSGDALLIGIPPDGEALLPTKLRARVKHDGFLRWLESDGVSDVRELLIRAGFVELTRSQWIREPKIRSAADLVQEITELLGRSSAPESSAGFRIIDTNTPVTHYRSRWKELRRETGRFVARRPQAYGAELWCVIEADNGRVTRLYDLPLPQSVGRGCDDAWWVQAAIDATAGAPQVVRTRGAHSPEDPVTLDFFSPIPRWIQRQLEAVANLVDGPSLLSFKCSTSDASEELERLQMTLWLKVIGTGM